MCHSAEILLGETVSWGAWIAIFPLQKVATVFLPRLAHHIFFFFCFIFSLAIGSSSFRHGSKGGSSEGVRTPPPPPPPDTITTNNQSRAHKGTSCIGVLFLDDASLYFVFFVYHIGVGREFNLGWGGGGGGGG